MTTPDSGNADPARPWEQAGQRASNAMAIVKAAATSAKEPAGRLVITWAPGYDGGLRPFQCTLADADTGDQITTVTSLVIVADCNRRSPITAELTMLCNSKGEFLRTCGPVADGHGGYHTGAFRWVVVEMRIGSELSSGAS